VGRIDPPSPPTGQFEVGIQAVDSQTEQLLPGVTVKACSKDAIDCTGKAPFGEGTTGPDGVANIPILIGAIGASGYPGFLEITRDGYYPMLLWFDPPVTISTFIAIDLFSKTLLDEELRSSDLALDDKRGAVDVVAVDCHRVAASGASVHASTADASSRTAYVRDRAAAGQLLDFTAKTTITTGAGIVFNVPPGPTEVSTRVEDLCLETAKSSIVVRAGAMSLVILGPLPGASR